MSKAEDYITQNTKTLEEYGKEYFKWLTPDQARKAVEIAREETIEEVCELLKNNIAEYILPNKGLDLDWFIEDLKRLMKNE